MLLRGYLFLLFISSSIQAAEWPWRVQAPTCDQFNGTWEVQSCFKKIGEEYELVDDLDLNTEFHDFSYPEVQVIEVENSCHQLTLKSFNSETSTQTISILAQGEFRPRGSKERRFRKKTLSIGEKRIVINNQWKRGAGIQFMQGYPIKRYAVDERQSTIIELREDLGLRLKSRYHLVKSASGSRKTEVYCDFKLIEDPTN